MMVPSPTGGEPWTWRRFDRLVRTRDAPLLRRLPTFDDAVLVGGCQRSGTTMVADILAASEGMHAIRTGDSHELDAALALSGEIPHEPQGRYCLQTTYLDDCWREYLQTPARFRLVWCLRNPHAVVASMLFHWAPFALMDTFRRCGVEQLPGPRRLLHQVFGIRTVSPIERACLAYVSKVSQALTLQPALGATMLIVDYDDLVAQPVETLGRIYDFVGLRFRPDYTRGIGIQGPPKTRRLSARQRARIERMCGALYAQARVLAERAAPPAFRRAAGQ